MKMYSLYPCKILRYNYWCFLFLFCFLFLRLALRCFLVNLLPLTFSGDFLHLLRFSFLSKQHSLHLFINFFLHLVLVSQFLHIRLSFRFGMVHVPGTIKPLLPFDEHFNDTLRPLQHLLLHFFPTFGLDKHLTQNSLAAGNVVFVGRCCIVVNSGMAVLWYKIRILSHASSRSSCPSSPIIGGCMVTPLFGQYISKILHNVM